MLVQSKKQGDLILFTTLIALFAISSAIHQPSLWIVIFAAVMWSCFVIPKAQSLPSCEKTVFDYLLMVYGWWLSEVLI